jgi:hypothetical protein
MAPKRGYSRAYPLPPPSKNKTRYLLDAIPDGLWHRVRTKAKREGVSLRTLILSLLDGWVRGQIKLKERT